ncbi:MAG: hypothetical protein AAB336_08635 [Acidobacteriota bacterium]
MKKMSCKKSVWLIIIGIVFTITSTVSAQPAMSRGEQRLSISYDECISRAERAFTNEGWVNIGKGGAFVNAFKENNGAYIMCNVAPDNKIWVNIVVASSSQDNSIAGGERVKLQRQMENSGSTASCNVPKISGTYSTSGDPVGIMVIDYQNGSYVSIKYGKDENSLVNRFEGNFNCNVLSGTFTNTIYNSTGTFKYEFSNDGSTFSGTWWNKGGGEGQIQGRKN